MIKRSIKVLYPVHPWCDICFQGFLTSRHIIKSSRLLTSSLFLTILNSIQELYLTAPCNYRGCRCCLVRLHNQDEPIQENSSWFIMISNGIKEPYQVDPSGCISFRCYLVWRNNLGCLILKIVSLNLTLENSIKELYLAPPLNYISFQYCSTRLSRKGDSHWRFFSLFLDILDSIR